MECIGRLKRFQPEQLNRLQAAGGVTVPCILLALYIFFLALSPFRQNTAWQRLFRLFHFVQYKKYIFIHFYGHHFKLGNKSCAESTQNPCARQAMRGVNYDYLKFGMQKIARSEKCYICSTKYDFYVMKQCKG